MGLSAPESHIVIASDSENFPCFSGANRIKRCLTGRPAFEALNKGLEHLESEVKLSPPRGPPPEELYDRKEIPQKERDLRSEFAESNSNR